MEEDYNIRDGLKGVYLEMNKPVDIDGSILVTKHVKTNDGYELVTRDGEMQYISQDDGCQLVGHLADRPFRLTLSESFADEFEKKVEETREY
jgi:hypothetical protein